MNNSGQKLWGLFLVVDSFFVVIFGGALAAKIYERWQQPMLAVAIPQSRGVHMVAKKAPLPALKPAVPLVATPVLAKASVITPVTHPNPLQSGKREVRRAADPTILAARGKGKAIGVIFHYKNKKAKKVILAGAFLLHSGKKSFLKAGHGSWRLTVYLTPGIYRYYFLVDGKRILDPQNQKHDRRASFFSITKPKR